MKERIALITGCGGPLGQAFARVLLEKGHKVVAVDVNQPRLREFTDRYPHRCLPYVLDVTDENAVAEMAAELSRGPGNPDILINNAGLLSKNKLEGTSPEEWRRILEVNLTGPFLLCRAFMPAMVRAGWGRVINISSLAAKSGGITAGTAYTASKGGIISLTFSLAAETAGSGVTVNAIAPAYVKTPMITEQLSEDERNAVRAKIPVGRFCEPEEVAALAAFLASEEAGFITGEVVDQNGGLHYD